MELGLNQRQLADRVVDQDPAKNGAVTNQTISNWERGINEPGAHYKSALATALEVDVSYFVAKEPKGETPTPFDDSDLATPAARDIITAMFESIEQRVISQLAEHAREVKAQLTEQTSTLAEMKQALVGIEASIRRENEARAGAQAAAAEAEEARKRLLEAAQVASQAYEDAARRLAEARGTQAT